jgi:hypothetical protein
VGVVMHNSGGLAGVPSLTGGWRRVDRLRPAYLPHPDRGVNEGRFRPRRRADPPSYDNNGAVLVLITSSPVSPVLPATLAA